jgi:ABC-type uncharacterized transport system auxiliary subunit
MSRNVRWLVLGHFLLVVLAGCTRPKEVVPELYTLDAAPDAVFRQAIALLAEWNMPIAHSDRETGVITTDQFVLGQGDEFLGEGAGHWADCGTELLISRAATADEFRMRCSITLRPEKGGKTQLRVQTNMSVYEAEALGSKTRSCSSRGRLEAKLVEDLAARLASQGD